MHTTQYSITVILVNISCTRWQPYFGTNFHITNIYSSSHKRPIVMIDIVKARQSIVCVGLCSWCYLFTFSWSCTHCTKNREKKHICPTMLHCRPDLMAVRLQTYFYHLFRRFLLHLENFSSAKTWNRRIVFSNGLSKNWPNSIAMDWTMSIVNFTAPLTFTISDQVWYLVLRDELPFGFVGGKMQ